MKIAKRSLSAGLVGSCIPIGWWLGWWLGGVEYGGAPLRALVGFGALDRVVVPAHK